MNGVINELIKKNQFILNFLDNLTYYHCLNVAKIVSHFTNDIEMIEGALLHDIGKVFLVKKLFKKHNIKKDESYYNYIKLHTLYGYEFYKKFSDNYNDHVANIILMHHERENGKGYPAGLQQHSFYIEKVKLISFADVFDALYNVRIYRKKKTYDFNFITNILKQEFGNEYTDLYLKDIKNISDKNIE